MIRIRLCAAALESVGGFHPTGAFRTGNNVSTVHLEDADAARALGKAMALYKVGSLFFELPGEAQPNPKDLEPQRIAALEKLCDYQQESIGIKDARIAELEARCREVAQLLIAEIGASGPEDIDTTAARAANRIAALEEMLKRFLASRGAHWVTDPLTIEAEALLKAKP